MIEEISEAAYEAIEQAASEGARAAMLASLDREVAVLQEAKRLRMEADTAKKAGIKNAVITGVICFLSGFVTGAIVMRN
ncbi:MAG: ABC transporter permease [Treponema sp.]|nr:ABC transporter permease [Treponema sp.]